MLNRFELLPAELKLLVIASQTPPSITYRDARIPKCRKLFYDHNKNLIAQYKGYKIKMPERLEVLSEQVRQMEMFERAGFSEHTVEKAFMSTFCHMPYQSITISTQTEVDDF